MPLYSLARYFLHRGVRRAREMCVWLCDMVGVLTNLTGQLELTTGFIFALFVQCEVGVYSCHLHIAGIHNGDTCNMKCTVLMQSYQSLYLHLGWSPFRSFVFKTTHLSSTPIETQSNNNNVKTHIMYHHAWRLYIPPPSYLRWWSISWLPSHEKKQNVSM